MALQHGQMYGMDRNGMKLVWIPLFSSFVPWPCKLSSSVCLKVSEFDSDEEDGAGGGLGGLLGAGVGGGDSSAGDAMSQRSGRSGRSRRSAASRRSGKSGKSGKGGRRKKKRQSRIMPLDMDNTAYLIMRAEASPIIIKFLTLMAP